jgi:predicted permease
MSWECVHSWAANRQLFAQTLLDEVRRIPGVRAVSTTSILPMAPGGDNDVDFAIEGRPPAPGNPPTGGWYRFVSPDYFATMGMRLVAGRFFTAEDRANSPGVVVVNETFARRFFGDESPIGRVLLLNDSRAEIVGIVGDVRQRGLSEKPVHEFFVPSTQNMNGTINLVVRTANNTDISAALRDVLRRIDPNLAPPELTPMQNVVDQTIALPRLYSAFFIFFAVVAVLLASVGIYGLTAFAVSQRKQEIGIRLAVGARDTQVVALVVRQAMTLAAAGVIIGLAAAAALARTLTRLLFEMSAADPTTFLAVPLVLGVVALAACWLPARRAARVDPLTALRSE